MGFVADRIQRIGESATLRISAKASQLKAEGVDIIDLSIGEPDFPTPENIRNAGKKAIDANFTKYTANDGIAELKKAIAKKFKEENGLSYNTDEIIVSSGAKNCLYNLCVAIFNKDDEAIIPAPYWVSYPEMVNLAKGTPVYLQCREENGFRLDPKDLAETITPKTKALFLNNPCNPTGAAYGKEELEEILKICLGEGVLIIADEIYEKLVYDGFRFHSIASLAPKARDIVVVINGVSKSYSMTGWRIGYAAGPKEIIAAMSKVQSHNTSNACSISQKAAVEALTGSQMELQKMVYQFERRRNIGLARLRGIPGISCAAPQGAFYLFPNVQAYFAKEYDGVQIRNSYGVAYYLLKRAHVAVVPGDAFGAEGFIRLSYATSERLLEEGIKRIGEALAELRPARREKRKAVSNTVTQIRSFVEMESNINLAMKEALVAESETFFTHDSYYEWNVNIGGVILQLRTNSPHLNDFWIENFYPAHLEADIEPHGIIYAVNWITGREPRAYYSRDSNTAFFFKSAYYAQLRTIAIGMVADISQKLFNLHMVNAACFDIDGSGVLMFFPAGCGRGTHITGLLKHPRAKIVSPDVVLVRQGGSTPVADSIERKFYLPTEWVEKYPPFKPLFERSKCENVVAGKDLCENPNCAFAGECDLDRGEPLCFIGSPVSRAMLDPYWIGGPDKHSKRAQVKTVLIFKREDYGAAIEPLSAEQALKMLEDGRPPADEITEKSRPFYNHFLLDTGIERIELQKRFYRRLLEKCQTFSVNIGGAPADKVRQTIIETVTGQGRAVLR